MSELMMKYPDMFSDMDPEDPDVKIAELVHLYLRENPDEEYDFLTLVTEIIPSDSDPRYAKIESYLAHPSCSIEYPGENSVAEEGLVDTEPASEVGLLPSQIVEKKFEELGVAGWRALCDRAGRLAVNTEFDSSDAGLYLGDQV